MNGQTFSGLVCVTTHGHQTNRIPDGAGHEAAGRDPGPPLSLWSAPELFTSIAHSTKRASSGTGHPDVRQTTGWIGMFSGPLGGGVVSQWLLCPEGP